VIPFNVVKLVKEAKKLISKPENGVVLTLVIIQLVTGYCSYKLEFTI
jgi:hypothetical protein